jgi:hypothetical protein
MRPAFVSVAGAVVSLGCAHGAHAQNAATTAQGTAFANSIAPTSPAQVVNPAGVNSTAWGTSASTPSTVPQNLGAFSQPNTSGANLSAAKSMGLSGLGNQAVSQCANFVPTPTSDPLQVQACAAVNFLTNQCMTPNNTQQGVISKLGMSQTAGSNCGGTYGQSVQNFNMAGQLSGTDTMFSVTSGLKTNATTATSATCAPQTVQTSPPKYALNTCVKDINTITQICSQNLQTVVTPAHGTCPSGGSLASAVFYRTSTPQDTVSITAACDLTAQASAIPFSVNAWGSRGACAPGLNVKVDMTQPQPQGPNAPPLLGQIVPHWLGSCMPMAVLWTGPGCTPCTGDACATATCTATFHIVSWPGTVPTYRCPSGWNLDQTCTDDGNGNITCTPTGTCSSNCDINGNNCSTMPATTGWDWAPGIHLQNTMTFPVPANLPASVATSWTDACTPYETSAGITLPLPTP